ncbi:MAG: hypothetical protein JNJ77_16065 [Planctomycetia bacterium]|nr:hypothetical protein [Planctomycetia bacterium]
MSINTDKPVGPGRFQKPPKPYDVVIAADGKIQVRKDDWLSKYSWALYGDYFVLDVFVRPEPKLKSLNDEIKGIKEIDNKDAIEAGEILIHVPTYFDWMERQGKPVQKPRPKPKTPEKPENVKTSNWQAAQKSRYRHEVLLCASPRRCRLRGRSLRELSQTSKKYHAWAGHGIHSRPCCKCHVGTSHGQSAF